TAEFAHGDARLRTSIGHGSPFIYGEVRGGNPTITFPQPPEIWSGGRKDSALGVTIQGRHYALFGPSGSKWSGQGGNTLTNETNRTYFSIALLPDRRRETFELFRKYAHNHVTGTQVIPKAEKGQLISRYEYTIKNQEPGSAGTLFALYPHQWKYTQTPLSKLSYPSVRGEMKLGAGLSFTTSVPLQGVLPFLPKEGIPNRKRMTAYLEEEANKPRAEVRDTYWEGKHLGTLATLSGICEALGESRLQKRFLTEIKHRLEDWFVADPAEEFPLFYYNSTWGTLIGSKPSYGSDRQLNDHHFHYGYFIRAAAEVARVDPKWAQKWSPMINLLIRDIASTSPTDPKFPAIRGFDLYAGHSWASGHADFADGNNQESSSESMNAWYGMMLWGEATGDDLIRDTGVFLFNTERTAIEEYWFDVSETNFPDDFPQVALGMVWGGKGAFATWFSGEIDCIHGINWLPFTPASLYMGRHPDYVSKNHARIVQERPQGDDYNNGWGDLVVMFGALSEPTSAANYIDSHPNCHLEGGNTHAFMYHWCHTLNTLGINDSGITSDHPFTGVFNHNGRKTYVAYHFGNTSKRVNFSDGTNLIAAPRVLTVSKAR
ncbi:MAG: glycosyl hydrolase, partial [Verrucomicrobiales bacterium]